MRFTSITTIVAICALSGTALGATLALSDGGGVRDDDVLVPSPVLPVADREAQLRHVLTRPDRRIRSFFEFDLSTLDGPVVDSATVSSGFFTQDLPLSSVAPAEISYFVYGADGALTIDDYDNFDDAALEVQLIGQIIRPDGAAGWTVDLAGADITAAVQAVVDAGFSHVGFGAQLNPALNFTSSGLFLRELDLDVVAVPEPTALALLGVVGLIACRRR